MSSLTDEELLRVVGVDATDWTPEALEVAHAEVRRRGLIVTVSTRPVAAKRPPYGKSASVAVVILLLVKVLLMLWTH
jgi:hypothetical protein